MRLRNFFPGKGKTLKLICIRQQQGHNAILHEIYHKLDMLNGCANGIPPLHFSLQTEKWTATFSLAYQKLNNVLSITIEFA